MVTDRIVKQPGKASPDGIRPLEIRPDRGLTSEQWAVARALADCQTPEAIAADLGIGVSAVRTHMRSSRVLQAVASQCLIFTHSHLLAKSLRTVSALMEGFLLSRKKIEVSDSLGRKILVDQLVEIEASVPASVRLTAAQTVLQLVRVDQAPQDVGGDLSEATADQLRALVAKLESELGGRARDVTPGAPDNETIGAHAEGISDESPNPYSVLD